MERLGIANDDNKEGSEKYIKSTKQEIEATKIN